MQSIALSADARRAFPRLRVPPLVKFLAPRNVQAPLDWRQVGADRSIPSKIVAAIDSHCSFLAASKRCRPATSQYPVVSAGRSTIGCNSPLIFIDAMSSSTASGRSALGRSALIPMAPSSIRRTATCSGLSENVIGLLLPFWIAGGRPARMIVVSVPDARGEISLAAFEVGSLAHQPAPRVRDKTATNSALRSACQARQQCK